jgi:hypothetical protein
MTRSGHGAGSFDYLVGEVQDGLGNREVHRLRGFEVDDEDELCRKLNRQFAGLGTPQNTINIDRRTADGAGVPDR